MWAGGNPETSGVAVRTAVGPGRREQGKLGSRQTYDAARSATVCVTDTPTVSGVQSAHDIGARGEARGWALSLLWRSASQLAAAGFLPRGALWLCVATVG